MRYSIGWAVLLSTLSGNTALAAPAGTPGAAEATQSPTRIQGGLPAPTGRLKFKSAGPVCICGEGLSERDIEKAMAKFKTDKDSVPGSDADRSQAGAKERNLNSGVSK